MADIFIGIDLGGTNVKIGCFDAELHLLGKTSIPTQADMGPEDVIDRTGRVVEELLAKAGASASELAAVGVGTPGPARYREGVLIKLCNLPNFVDVPLRQMLADRLGVPAIIENDGNAACYGEFVAGAGKDIEDMVFFTLGTGIGGGIVCEGKLVHGSGDNGAELGHMIIYPGGRLCNCGQRGCVEAYASASNTARRATEAVEQGEESSLKKVLGEKGEITSKDVYEHLKQGDALAGRIADETAEALAILCINMLHVTEPKRIVLAGGMIAAGDVLLNAIREHFEKHIWSLKKETVEICFATLGEDAGIIGAAALAREMICE